MTSSYPTTSGKSYSGSQLPHYKSCRVSLRTSILRWRATYIDLESRLNTPVTGRLFSLTCTIGRQQSKKRIDFWLS